MPAYRRYLRLIARPTKTALLRGRFSFALLHWDVHPRSLGPMVGLVRLHAYRNCVFNLVDVPQKEAKKKRVELSREGFIVTHTEFV